ncbi:MAG TPA: hypothetical protein VF799_05500 [Geobacteraceae bacterium]
MTQEKDDRKRAHLRLVVNNEEHRKSRPAAGEEEFIPFDKLIARRDTYRADFYHDMGRWQTKAYVSIERFMERRGWIYGLDPQHGRLLVLPIAAICPDAIEQGGSPQDEALIYIAEDTSGEGLCLSLETILPFWSEDESVMEEALIYAPIFQYGTLFLEENRQDGLLDLIYRLGFPIYPPALTERLLDRFFAISAYELREALRSLAEYPEA